MDALLRDLRFAVRGLLRTPGFTIAALLALALGIGATTAIFSVVHAVLLRSLGWGEESRLVAVTGNFAAQNLFETPVSVPEYLDLRKAPFLSQVGVYYDDQLALQTGDRAERVSAGYATGSFLEALGVRPVQGRSFSEEEDQQGNSGVALLFWEAWRKRFGGDPAAVGRSVTVNGLPRTIVGILPAGFRWDAPHEFFIPFGWQPADLHQRGNRYLHAVAQLRPGFSLPSAQTALETFSAELRAAHPDAYRPEVRWRLTLAPLRDLYLGSARQPLLMLFGAVILVLCIACANVANLLLARGAARSREIAVRSALGAGRGRLLRQLLTESALLAVIGAAGGVLLSVWSLDLLLAAAPQPVRQLADVQLNRVVLAFAAGLTILTTVFFGPAPALQATRTDLAGSLKEGAPTTAAGKGRLRAALVVGQLALSLVLLVGAGLLLRSFAGVLRVAPGFDTRGVLAAQVSLGGPAYAEGAAQAQYWAEALRRAAALPGVESAGAINIAPMLDTTDWSYTIEDHQPKPGEPYPDDQFRRATPGYFRALRIPVRGREFSDTDDAKARPVLLVNEAWARRFFPGREVIGRRVRMGGREGPWRSIVGVVGDAHDFGLEKPTPPVLYAPEAQMPESYMVLMLKITGGLPAAVAPALRAALTGIDATQPVDWIEPFEDRLSAGSGVGGLTRAMAPRRFPLQLLGAFAALALLLSALGVYGVTAYGVTQRTREIGVRIAIGAQASDVLRLVIGGTLKLAGAGVGIGLCAALLGARLLSAQLYGVSARDPITYGAIALLLALVALLASFLPARRAARVDPMSALRAE